MSAQGLPLAQSLTATDANDCKEALPLLDDNKLVRSPRGLPRKRLRTVHADKAYNHHFIPQGCGCATSHVGTSTPSSPISAGETKACSQARQESPAAYAPSMELLQSKGQQPFEPSVDLTQSNLASITPKCESRSSRYC